MFFLSKNECLDQKTYLAKVERSAQKRGVGTFQDPFSHFLGPLVVILDFEGSALLQVVSECHDASRLVLVICQKSTKTVF